MYPPSSLNSHWPHVHPPYVLGSHCLTSRPHTWPFTYSVSDSKVAFTPPPSPCPLSLLTHALRSVGLLCNQTPGLVPVPDRPFTYSVSDSKVAFTPPPSPFPRSSLTHVLRSVGLLRDQTPGLRSVSVRPFGYSVSDSRVSCTPFPLPSPLDTTFPRST